MLLHGTKIKFTMSDYQTNRTIQCPVCVKLSLRNLYDDEIFDELNNKDNILNNNEALSNHIEASITCIEPLLCKNRHQNRDIRFYLYIQNTEGDKFLKFKSCFAMCAPLKSIGPVVIRSSFSV